MELYDVRGLIHFVGSEGFSNPKVLALDNFLSVFICEICGLFKLTTDDADFHRWGQLIS
jgi:hypothetical protein